MGGVAVGCRIAVVSSYGSGAHGTVNAGRQVTGLRHTNAIFGLTFAKCSGLSHTNSYAVGCVIFTRTSEPLQFQHFMVQLRFVQRPFHTFQSPTPQPTTHSAGAGALIKPKNHRLDRSKPCRAEWRPKRFRCINRWCSDLPKKTSPK